MAKNGNLLRFVTPPRWWGEKWREGLYVGNGKLGANVYGGAAEERILVNDSSLAWMGRTTVVPDVSENVAQVIDLINDGEFLRAQKVLPDALAAKNFRPRTEYPLPLAELSLHFKHSVPTTDYRRTLDMERGVATVSYYAGGTKYVRDIFVSRTDNAVVYRLTKNGNGTISFDFTVGLPHRVNARTYEGICDMPEGATVYEKQYVCFAARNDDTGADYGLVCKVTPLGGTVRNEEDKLVVKNAQQLLIFVKTFVGSRERKFAELKTELASMRDGYEKMLKTHAALHSKMYNSANVRLGGGKDQTAESLLSRAETGDLTPQLCEKMYKFARYLFVCGTSADDGGLFAPSGLWNGSYKPYRSCVTYDGQMQTAYLFALQGNLYSGIDKTFDNFDRYIGDYKNNAQRIFNCRGAVVPVVQAPKTGRLGTTDVFGVHFSGCAAWLCNFYYSYVKISGNVRFLRSKLLPFMKEVALFYLDIVRDGEDGGVDIIPSALPMRINDGYKLEGRPIVGKNSTLDFELCRDLLTNLIEACNTLNVKADERWQRLLDRLPQPQTGSDGAMKEFVNSVIGVDYTGVSNGTLYPAYFGKRVDLLCDKETLDLYRRTADRKRANPSSQNSFNTCVLASVYARLGLADKALQSLGDAVRGCVIDNLVMLDKDWRGMGVCGSGVWSPVQLTSNLVFANAVQQMLLYGHDNYVNVMPAVPDEWNFVEFEDLVCDNGVTVSAVKDAAKGLFKVSLCAKRDIVLTLRLPEFVRKLVKFGTEQKPEGKCFEVQLHGGKSCEFVYKIPQIKAKTKAEE